MDVLNKVSYSSILVEVIMLLALWWIKFKECGSISSLFGNVDNVWDWKLIFGSKWLISGSIVSRLAKHSMVSSKKICNVNIKKFLYQNYSKCRKYTIVEDTNLKKAL